MQTEEIIRDKRLDENMKSYLEACVSGGKVTQRSLQAYKYDLANFAHWLQTEQPGTVNGGICEQYIKALVKKQSLRQGTITRKAKVLKSYLSYLNSAGKLSTAESHFVMPDVSHLNRKSVEPLSRSETDRLFEAMKRYYENLDTDFLRMVSNRDCCILLLLYYNRLEISEVLSAKLSDYDRKTQTLTITKADGKSRREQIFAKDLQDGLKRWLIDHSYFERNADYDDYLFISKIGRPLSMQQVCKVFNTYRDYAGLDKSLTAQSLKQSMAKYAEELLMERYRGEAG